MLNLISRYLLNLISRYFLLYEQTSQTPALPPAHGFPFWSSPNFQVSPICHIPPVSNFSLHIWACSGAEIVVTCTLCVCQSLAQCCLPWWMDFISCNFSYLNSSFCPPFPGAGNPGCCSSIKRVYPSVQVRWEFSLNICVSAVCPDVQGMEKSLGLPKVHKHPFYKNKIYGAGSVAQKCWTYPIIFLEGFALPVQLGFCTCVKLLFAAAIASYAFLIRLYCAVNSFLSSGK